MSTSKSTKSYAKLNKELDLVLNKFESEDLDIDSAIELYEQANKLIQQMQIHLDKAKNKINKLKAV